MMKIKDRLWAVGWLCYLIGSISATKGFEPQVTFETFKWWDKLLAIFIFAFTMLLGYMAGKEELNK